MEQKENQGFMSRRGMLKSFGLAGAAVAAAPIFGAGEAALRAATNSTGSSAGPKVGILLPEGNYSASFMNGFYLWLESQNGGAPFSPFVEKFDATHSAYGKLNDLTNAGKIDIAVALMNTRVSSSLSHLLEKSGIKFVEANLGENFFHPEFSSQNFYQSSMNLWQSHYVLGTWAAANIGKKAICASSFFDSGYDALYAFTSGFKSAGGVISDTIISGNPVDNSSPVEAGALCASADADFVFANYSGHDAAIFLSAFKSTSGNEKKKIVASGMMTQPQVLKALGSNCVGLYSAHSWHNESSQASAEFAAAYRTKYHQEADDFAVLGYDTANIVARVLGKSVKIASARGGSLALNASTHASESPIFITQMARPDDAHILAKIELPAQITNANFRLTETMRSGATMFYSGM